MGIELRSIRTTGKTLCPKCSHDRKHKTQPCLNVNLIDGTYKCHNCDWKGRVFERSSTEKRIYVKPVFNNRTELSKKMVDWFASRSIGQSTLIDFKVTEDNEWMPQVYSEKFKIFTDQGKSEDEAKRLAKPLGTVNTIQFNYFRNGELINIKYRDGRKNFKLAKDAELIFYNLDAIKGAKKIIICEGEIDAMSWHEAGFKAVISVPNGAIKATEGSAPKLEYLDNCIELLQEADVIYISSDDDVPGRALRDELARRLDVSRCRMLDFGGEKDANDYLKAYGPERLLGLLEQSKEFPITGVISIADVWDGVLDFWENGLPDGDRTGIEQIDNHIRFMPGELTMVTGIPGHGKSVVLEQISLKLCINANWKFGVFSPESFPIELYIFRLIKKIVGCEVTKNNISREDMDNLKGWLIEHFFIIYPEDEGFILDILLAKAKQLVQMRGINGLILDPWNRIEGSRPAGMDEGRFTAEQLIKITKFNQRNGVHTFLVAHPTKMQKAKDKDNQELKVFEVPNLYSISGSAHFFNITQNGFTVYKNENTKETELHVQKIKWEHLGRKGMIVFRFVPQNTRIMPKLETQTDIQRGYLEADTESWLPNLANATNTTTSNGNAFPNPQAGLLRFNSPPGNENAIWNRPEINHDYDEEPPF